MNGEKEVHRWWESARVIDGGQGRSGFPPSTGDAEEMSCPTECVGSNSAQSTEISGQVTRSGHSSVAGVVVGHKRAFTESTRGFRT